ncbi:mitochondrial citrate synthase, putative [Ichthyophthirius multifiliis]|uniref:Citrate synthase n=1 Tax=Ichthyophthirius multifiliis TaxID=5932 RepID=G0QKS3_ICHMU|nr:mitochondrial citrate synthase, putative [Ichthyophthirius multifiliis]EGR34195.1 mitochondrial citrate synthase, putative [Ichthyophthirius multifiliis]|eukprot:XP_004039499.1 mitochondrial citrate synthase, putative [Ichthyophthirius multifiliis]
MKTLSQKIFFPFSKQNTDLKLVLKDLIPQKQAELQLIKEKYGDKIVGEYNVKQVIGGMRGIKGLMSDLSRCDPWKGIMFRNYSIPQLKEFLPKYDSKHHEQNKLEPLPEGIFWLLMTGELPNQQQVESIKKEWQHRGVLDKSVVDYILSLPQELHSMTMLSMAVLYLQKDSKFAHLYDEGRAVKKEYWIYFYEDAMDLIAKINKIAAIIYRHKYHNSQLIDSHSTLDWAGNYSHMLGFDNIVVQECLRGYLSVHCDHESGNVSAHTTHLVGSALSDPYLSYSAGINGLAGPLHGLANQEVLKWMLDFVKEKGFEVSDKDIEDYVDSVIQSGKVVPGYGHAVLRDTDPRFHHQQDFALQYMKDDKYIKLLHQCAEVIPKKLKSYHKIANPYPNVDCHSGITLYALGLKEYQYYTVIFAVSRALGCMANLIWSRAFGLPIERPGSVDLQWFKDKYGHQ